MSLELADTTKSQLATTISQNMDTHPQQHRKVSGSAAIARRLGTKLGLRKLDKPEAAASMADAISSTSSAVTAAPARMANAAIVNGQLGRLEEAQNEKQRRQRPVSVSQYGTPNQSVDFHFSSVSPSRCVLAAVL